MSLGSALKTMEVALNFGKAWTREEFASYGSKKSASSAKSGAFATRVAALRSYGLISSTKDTIVATELAEQLVRPVDQAEQKAALVRAFLNVDTFRKIYEETTHEVELPKSNIHSIAVTRYGIARDPRTIASFVGTFVHSGISAGLITAVGSDKIILKDNALDAEQNSDSSVEEAAAQDLGAPAVETQSAQQPTAPQSTSSLALNTTTQNGINVQGVEHTGKNWHLVVSFSSSLTVKSDMRAKIRALIASADEVADVFYDLEEEEAKV